MTFAEFHNSLRILSSLDHHELPFLSAEQWVKFRDHPMKFFVQCDEETSAKIFAAVEKRGTNVRHS